MTPALMLDAVDTAPAMIEDDFELDLRVIESTIPLVTMLCDTGDGCGSTCEKSACTTNAAQPF
ncbi:hypothetical protein GCM10027059_14170 [Myceligenerans halotolerans]